MVMVLLILIEIVICLVVIVFFTKVKIYILFGRQGEEDQGEVVITVLGGLIKRRLKIPTIDFKNLDKGIEVKAETDSATSEKKNRSFINKDFIEHFYEKYEELLHRISHLQEMVRWFFARITCEHWKWETMIGTGDAAEAGVLTGVVWSVKSNVLGFLSHYIRWVTVPKLDVVPNFGQAVFQTTYEGIFHFRLGNLIRFGIKLWFRLRKHRKTNWQPKSDSLTF
jgi:hypothetical protein